MIGTWVALITAAFWPCLGNTDVYQCDLSVRVHVASYSTLTLAEILALVKLTIRSFSIRNFRHSFATYAIRSARHVSDSAWPFSKSELQTNFPDFQRRNRFQIFSLKPFHKIGWSCISFQCAKRASLLLSNPSFLYCLFCETIRSLNKTKMASCRSLNWSRNIAEFQQLIQVSISLLGEQLIALSRNRQDYLQFIALRKLRLTFYGHEIDSQNEI